MFIVQCSGFPLERGVHRFMLTLLLFLFHETVRKTRVMIMKSRKTSAGRYGEAQEARKERRAELSEEPRRE